MTYLEMVNNILKRLREREVSSINENAYSALIGVLINDAKQEVENSWDWSALRTTLTAVTSENIFSYELTGSGHKITMLDVVNDTDDVFMRYMDAHEMNRRFLLADPEAASPLYYSYNGLTEDGDTVVDIYPIPDGVYRVRFNMIIRQPDLEADTDTLEIPTHPVLMLAYAKAIEERGEDGGIGASSAYATAARSLADLISIDAAKHPEELIWSEV